MEKKEFEEIGMEILELDENALDDVLGGVQEDPVISANNGVGCTGDCGCKFV